MLSVMSNFSVMARRASFFGARADSFSRPHPEERALARVSKDEVVRKLARDSRTRSPSSSRPLRQERGELGADAGVELLAGARLDGEGVAPRPRLAGVDDDAGIARVVGAVGPRVERGAPASTQGLNVLAGIEP